MQKQQVEAEILEKVPLKQKLVIKNNIKEKNDIMIAKFAPQDSLIACGVGDGYVRIYNLIKNARLAEFNTNVKDKESQNSTPVNTLKWRPASERHESVGGAVLLAANTNGHLFQFRVNNHSSQVWHGIQSDNQIFALDYAPEGQHFATAGLDNVIRIYDEDTKKISQELKGQFRHKSGHSNRVFGLKFNNKNPSLLVSGGWDQNVHVWDLRVNKVTQTIVGPRITGDSVDFRDDYLLTGSSRISDQLQLWDYRIIKLLHTFEWDSNTKFATTQLNSCHFCPNSTSTILAAGGQQAKMFSLDDYSQFFELRVPENDSLYSCDTSSINNKYVASGKKGQLYYMATNKYGS